MYEMMSGWGGGWSLMMYLAMAAFWVGVVALVVLAVRSLTGPAQSHAAPPAQHEGAMDVLRRRYAAGEIDGTEFQQKKRDLA
jgi:putative membrane protein